MLKHGGAVLTAASQYGIPDSQWLDLSTGINPNGWNVPYIPPEIWQKLPQRDDNLEQAAKQYLGATNLVPSAGSQAAIQMLPELKTICRVGFLFPSYAEHIHAWKRCGHQVVQFNEVPTLEENLDKLDVLVITNPGNPTGLVLTPQQLVFWWEKLRHRSGWLVVDEAFMDATNELSLATYTGQYGLVVMRSLGKFFGLSGARIGFVLAWTDLIEQLVERFGPWDISGPSRYVATLALNDIPWQQQTKINLSANSSRLQQLLEDNQLTVSGGTCLFKWVVTPQADILHEYLARKAILSRLFLEPLSLRFGLPGTEIDWQRLNTALLSAQSDGILSITPEATPCLA